MDSSTKRKADGKASGDGNRSKTKKPWRTNPSHQSRQISAGDSGIWVTCNKGKEGKCTWEIRDLFNDYAEQLYPAAFDKTQDGDDAAEGNELGDIESEINAEISDMQKSKSSAAQLFTAVKLDMPCVLFMRTISPVDPVGLVNKICDDALANPSLKRTRFAKRLSPMTLMGRASVEGLEKVAKEVLEPHFHQTPFQKRKFAIRPTLRNHNILSRDSIIKQVASIVGPGHTVDLKNYDLLIIVEVYQHVCGVSVVDANFEKLKRYNIAEIFEPTPKEAIPATKADDNRADAADEVTESTEASTAAGPS